MEFLTTSTSDHLPSDHPSQLKEKIVQNILANPSNYVSYDPSMAPVDPFDVHEKVDSAFDPFDTVTVTTPNEMNGFSLDYSNSPERRIHPASLEPGIQVVEVAANAKYNWGRVKQEARKQIGLQIHNSPSSSAGSPGHRQSIRVHNQIISPPLGSGIGVHGRPDPRSSASADRQSRSASPKDRRSNSADNYNRRDRSGNEFYEAASDVGQELLALGGFGANFLQKTVQDLMKSTSSKKKLQESSKAEKRERKRENAQVQRTSSRPSSPNQASTRPSRPFSPPREMRDEPRETIHHPRPSAMQFIPRTPPRPSSREGSHFAAGHDSLSGSGTPIIKTPIDSPRFGIDRNQVIVEIQYDDHYPQTQYNEEGNTYVSEAVAAYESIGKGGYFDRYAARERQFSKSESEEHPCPYYYYNDPYNEHTNPYNEHHEHSDRESGGDHLYARENVQQRIYDERSREGLEEEVQEPYEERTFSYEGYDSKWTGDWNSHDRLRVSSSRGYFDADGNWYSDWYSQTSPTPDVDAASSSQEGRDIASGRGDQYYNGDDINGSGTDENPNEYSKVKSPLPASPTHFEKKVTFDVKRSNSSEDDSLTPEKTRNKVVQRGSITKTMNQKEGEDHSDGSNDGPIDGVGDEPNRLQIEAYEKLEQRRRDEEEKRDDPEWLAMKEDEHRSLFGDDSEIDEETLSVLHPHTFAVDVDPDQNDTNSTNNPPYTNNDVMNVPQYTKNVPSNRPDLSATDTTVELDHSIDASQYDNKNEKQGAGAVSIEGSVSSGGNRDLRAGRTPSSSSSNASGGVGKKLNPRQKYEKKVDYVYSKLMHYAFFYPEDEGGIPRVDSSPHGAIEDTGPHRHAYDVGMKGGKTARGIIDDIQKEAAREETKMKKRREMEAAGFKLVSKDETPKDPDLAEYENDMTMPESHKYNLFSNKMHNQLKYKHLLKDTAFSSSFLSIMTGGAATKSFFTIDGGKLVTEESLRLLAKWAVDKERIWKDKYSCLKDRRLAFRQLNPSYEYELALRDVEFEAQWQDMMKQRLKVKYWLLQADQVRHFRLFAARLIQHHFRRFRLRKVFWKAIPYQMKEHLEKVLESGGIGNSHRAQETYGRIPYAAIHIIESHKAVFHPTTDPKDRSRGHRECATTLRELRRKLKEIEKEQGKEQYPKRKGRDGANPEPPADDIPQSPGFFGTNRPVADLSVKKEPFKWENYEINYGKLLEVLRACDVEIENFHEVMNKPATFPIVHETFKFPEDGTKANAKAIKGHDDQGKGKDKKGKAGKGGSPHSPGKPHLRGGARTLSTLSEFSKGPMPEGHDSLIESSNDRQSDGLVSDEIESRSDDFDDIRRQIMHIREIQGSDVGSSQYSSNESYRTPSGPSISNTSSSPRLRGGGGQSPNRNSTSSPHKKSTATHAPAEHKGSRHRKATASHAAHRKSNASAVRHKKSERKHDTRDEIHHKQSDMSEMNRKTSDVSQKSDGSHHRQHKKSDAHHKGGNAHGHHKGKKRHGRIPTPEERIVRTTPMTLSNLSNDELEQWLRDRNVLASSLGLRPTYLEEWENYCYLHYGDHGWYGTSRWRKNKERTYKGWKGIHIEMPIARIMAEKRVMAGIEQAEKHHHKTSKADKEHAPHHGEEKHSKGKHGRGKHGEGHLADGKSKHHEGQGKHHDKEGKPHDGKSEGKVVQGKLAEGKHKSDPGKEGKHKADPRDSPHDEILLGCETIMDHGESFPDFNFESSVSEQIDSGIEGTDSGIEGTDFAMDGVDSGGSISIQKIHKKHAMNENSQEPCQDGVREIRSMDLFHIDAPNAKQRSTDSPLKLRGGGAGKQKGVAKRQARGASIAELQKTSGMSKAPVSPKTSSFAFPPPKKGAHKVSDKAIVTNSDKPPPVADTYLFRVNELKPAVYEELRSLEKKLGIDITKLSSKPTAQYMRSLYDKLDHCKVDWSKPVLRLPDIYLNPSPFVERKNPSIPPRAIAVCRDVTSSLERGEKFDWEKWEIHYDKLAAFLHEAKALPENQSAKQNIQMLKDFTADELAKYLYTKRIDMKYLYLFPNFADQSVFGYLFGDKASQIGPSTDYSYLIHDESSGKPVIRVMGLPDKPGPFLKRKGPPVGEVRAAQAKADAEEAAANAPGFFDSLFGGGNAPVQDPEKKAQPRLKDGQFKGSEDGKMHYVRNYEESVKGKDGKYHPISVAYSTRSPDMSVTADAEEAARAAVEAEAAANAPGFFDSFFGGGNAPVEDPKKKAQPRLKDGQFKGSQDGRMHYVRNDEESVKGKDGKYHPISVAYSTRSPDTPFTQEAIDRLRIKDAEPQEPGMFDWMFYAGDAQAPEQPPAPTHHEGGHSTTKGQQKGDRLQPKQGGGARGKSPAGKGQAGAADASWFGSDQPAVGQTQSGKRKKGKKGLQKEAGYFDSLFGGFGGEAETVKHTKVPEMIDDAYKYARLCKKEPNNKFTQNAEAIDLDWSQYEVNLPYLRIQLSKLHINLAKYDLEHMTDTNIQKALYRERVDVRSLYCFQPMTASFFSQMTDGSEAIEDESISKPVWRFFGLPIPSPFLRILKVGPDGKPLVAHRNAEASNVRSVGDVVDDVQFFMADVGSGVSAYLFGENAPKKASAVREQRSRSPPFEAADKAIFEAGSTGSAKGEKGEKKRKQGSTSSPPGKGKKKGKKKT